MHKQQRTRQHKQQPLFTSYDCGITSMLVTYKLEKQRSYLTVPIVSDMHFNALRSLTQPCMTAYCIHHNTYDSGISPGSANQCVLGDVY